jgi:pimeloyl-ACP methyl ester carboxylesterase
VGAKSIIPVKRISDDENLVLFIHGLSGSSGTWDTMLQVLVQCRELDHVAYDCYTYPTSLIRMPFAKKMPSIQEIASGLKSFIDGHYANKKNVIIVAHSLGGLIARNYILEQLKGRLDHKIAGLILYASPLSGSGWSFASKFSWKHAHLKQLSVKTDFLNGMNSDWVTLQAEDKIKLFSVIAGVDAIVSPESSLPYIGAKNYATLIEHGHISVTKPQSLDDLRFVYLKNFICEIFNKKLIPDIAPISPLPMAFGCKDVLFDAYTNSVEEYYLSRREDEVVLAAVQSSNIWVSGPAGVGKTAVLRRLSGNSDWDLQHVILDGYRDLTALQLMREICNILLDRSGIEDIIPSNATQQELFTEFRKVFDRLLSQRPLAVLVEEIPLPSGVEYSNFLDLCYQISLLAETFNHKGKIVWMFSSIHDPKREIKPGVPKLFEKIQFIEFGTWRSDDIQALIGIITATLSIDITKEDLELIVSDCRGSPRFVKTLFRRARNEVGAKTELSELCSSVLRDLSR